METAITVATIAAATFVFLLYVAFVRWRIKVHRRRKEAREAGRAGLVDPTRLVELTGHRTVEDGPADRASAGDASTPGIGDPASDVRDGGPTPPATSATGSPPGGVDVGQRAASRPPATTNAPPRPTTSTRILVLADAVAGIRLGESFTPLVDVNPRPHAVDRAVFSSGTADAAAIRTRVTDALAAIGFEVTWTGLDAEAVRHDAVVAVAVVPEPTTAAIDGALAYPGAMLGNVVVDFWIPT